MAGGVTQVQGVVAADPSIAAITGTSSTGISVLLAQSWVAVSAPADTSEDILATITVPAGTFASNGAVRIAFAFTCTNNTNVKTARVRHSGIGGTVVYAVALTSQSYAGAIIEGASQGATNSQVWATISASLVSPSTATATPAVDTTAATTIVITAQKATSGDTVTLLGYTAEYIKASNS